MCWFDDYVTLLSARWKRKITLNVYNAATRRLDRLQFSWGLNGVENLQIFRLNVLEILLKVTIEMLKVS